MATGFRDWAKQKGINPNDIVYDPVTKQVKVNGVSYGGGTPTYTNRMTDMRSPSGTSLIGRQPVRVQTGQAFDETKLNNTYDVARIDEANRARESARMNYEKMLNQPKPFQYNQASDVGYQAANADYQRRMDDSLRANMENAAARGMFRSRSTQDRANQLIADETRRFNVDVAPQLEQQAYNRWAQANQDTLNRALAQYNLAENTYKDRFGAYDSARREREAQAQAKAKLLNDKAIADAKIQADKTAEANKYNRDLALVDKEFQNKKALTEMDYSNQSSLKDKQAGIDTKLTTLRNSQKSAGGGSGSSSGGGKSSKNSVPEFMSYKDAEDTLESTFIGENSLFTSFGKRTINPADEKSFVSQVNSLGLTAKDKIAIYNGFGLPNQANKIANDPYYQMAVNDPDKLIGTLAQTYKNENEFKRRVAYYGLYDYMMNQLNQ